MEGEALELTVAVCDDEPLAVARLQRLLRACVGIDIVSATTHGEDAIDRILELAPDVAFLDIEMPEPDGFEIVDRIFRCSDGGRRIPFVVFVTAHAEFATQAFETGAIDFLTKPVQLPRLEACLKRARAAVAGRTAADQLAELRRAFEVLKRERPTLTEREHVWIQRRGELLRLDMDEVTVIRAEAEYVRLFSKGASYLHRDSIGAIEARIDSREFVRIHRSTIVRRSEVVALRRSLHGGMLVRLANGEEFSIGRKYAKSARTSFIGRAPDPDGASPAFDEQHKSA